MWSNSRIQDLSRRLPIVDKHKDGLPVVKPDSDLLRIKNTQNVLEGLEETTIYKLSRGTAESQSRSISMTVRDLNALKFAIGKPARLSRERSVASGSRL